MHAGLFCKENGEDSAMYYSHNFNNKNTVLQSPGMESYSRSKRRNNGKDAGRKDR